MNKTIFGIVAGVVIFCAANAQQLPPLSSGQGDLVWLIGSSGADAWIPANSTNKFVTGSAGNFTTNSFAVPNGATSVSNLWIVNVGDCNDLGFTFAFTGTAGSTNGLLLFKSFDGAKTFEATASFAYTNLVPGASGFVTNGAITNLNGVTTLGIVVTGTGNSYSTNAVLNFFLKQPKVGALTADQ